MKKFFSKLNAGYFLIYPTVCFLFSPFWPLPLRSPDRRILGALLLCLFCLCMHFFMKYTERYSKKRLAAVYVSIIYILSVAAAALCLDSGVFLNDGEPRWRIICRFIVKCLVVWESIYFLYDAGCRENKVYSRISPRLRKRIDNQDHRKITRDTYRWEDKQSRYAEGACAGAITVILILLLAGDPRYIFIEKYQEFFMAGNDWQTSLYPLVFAATNWFSGTYGSWILIEEGDTLPFRI